jgi:hypothetical protein
MNINNETGIAPTETAFKHTRSYRSDLDPSF